MMFYKEELDRIAEALRVYADKQKETSALCKTVNDVSAAKSIELEAEVTKVLLSRVLEAINTKKLVHNDT